MSSPTRTSRIFYLVPEVEAPTGGVNTSFEHVALLNKIGLDAAILQMNSANPYPHAPQAVPVRFLDQGIPFREGDALVLPEASQEVYRQFADIPGIHRYVFCQNHFYFVNTLGYPADWKSLGISGVFACSMESSAFLRRTYPLTVVPVVPCAVDGSLFAPRDKKMQIAHMPRKRREDQQTLRTIFQWRYPELATIPWVPLDGIPREDVAAALGESAVFLSMGWMEGLGLPPLEAMAANALVVGFHGWGGLEYTSPENGLWVEEGNVDTCADALAGAIQMITEDPAAAGRIIAAGKQTAARFNRAAQRDALLALWTQGQ